MNQIIVYGSEYGTTKKYAEKLSELSGIAALRYEDVKTLQNYRRIIYLGGLYAGGVKGLKPTVKRIPSDVKLLLVTVGLADVTDPENIRNIRQSIAKQVPADLLQNTVLFHLRLQQTKRFTQNHDGTFIQQSEAPAGGEENRRSPGDDRDLQYQGRLCGFPCTDSHSGTNPLKTFQPV